MGIFDNMKDDWNIIAYNQSGNVAEKISNVSKFIAIREKRKLETAGLIVKIYRSESN